MAKDIKTIEKMLSDTGSADLLGKVQAALGTKSKDETLALIRKDPEARRIASKIIGAGSPAGIKAALDPSALKGVPAGQRKARVEF